MARDGKKTELTQGFVGRVVGGLRYAVLGDTSWFGPGAPPEPVAPPETEGRAWDYPTHYNLQHRPRQHEPISFEELRALADGYDLLRLVIETRKDQLAKLNYSVGFRQKPGQALRDPPDERCAELEEFLRRPDRRHGWATWLRMVLEDLFVIDAPAIYVRRNMAGGIYALEPIDGSTIKVVLSEDGRIPYPPEPAYQQYLKGLPAVDYTTEELVYFPRNPRAHKAYGFCYDEETEILTRDRGFVRFSEINPVIDMVATRSPSGAFEWQHPSRLVVEDWDGDMYHFHSRSVDLLVTPEHRMLVDSLPRPLGGGRSRPAGDAIVSAEDLAAHHNSMTKIPMTSTWEGEEIGEMEFRPTSPEVIEVERVLTDGTLQKYSRRANSPLPVTLSGDDYCALMGAYLAGGNLRCQGGIEVAQREESKGFTAYKALFDRLGGSHNGRSFVLPSRALTEYFGQFGHAHEKFIPEEIMNASRRQIEIFWNHYVLGDGNIQPRKNTSGRGSDRTGAVSITTVSRRMADQLVELAQKLGWSASVSVRRGGKQKILDRVSECRDSYRIRVRYSKAMAFSSKKVRYKGKIYCVTVPNGIVYVRRNGKPAWCGNSPVEQVIMTVNIAIRRQIHQMQLYTEGNIPEALAGVPETWTPEQIAQFQEYWDHLLEGDTAQRRHMKFIPGQLSIQFTKDPQLKDDFDEWLARVVCYAFSVPPLPFVKEQNRATANTAKEAALDEGLAPLMNWVKDMIDHVIQDLFGYHDLEFMWADEESMDPATKSQVDIAEVRIGLKSIDEIRAENGDDPVGMGHAIFGAGPLGILFLEDINTPEKREAMMAKMQGGPEGLAGDPLAGIPPETLRAMGIDDPAVVDALSKPHPQPPDADPNDPVVQAAIAGEDPAAAAESPSDGMQAFIDDYINNPAPPPPPGDPSDPVVQQAVGGSDLEPGDTLTPEVLRAFIQRYINNPAPPPPAPIADDPVVGSALHLAGQPGGVQGDAAQPGGDPVQQAVDNPPAMPPHDDMSGDPVVTGALARAFQQQAEQERPMDPVVREALRRQSPVKTEEDPAVQFRLGINSV